MQEVRDLDLNLFSGNWLTIFFKIVILVIISFPHRQCHNNPFLLLNE